MQLLLGGLAAALEDSVMFENSVSQLKGAGKTSSASLGDPSGDVISDEDIEVSLQKECISASQDSRSGFMLVMEDSEEDEDSSRRAGQSEREELDGPPHSDKENSLKRSLEEEGSTTQGIDERHSSARHGVVQEPYSSATLSSLKKLTKERSITVLDKDFSKFCCACVCVCVCV